jgi:hypothetical protein
MRRLETWKQLVGKLRPRKFSIQMDESTVRNGEVVSMVYVAYIDNGEFTEEVLFYEALQTTTTTINM